MNGYNLDIFLIIIILLVKQIQSFIFFIDMWHIELSQKSTICYHFVRLFAIFAYELVSFLKLQSRFLYLIVFNSIHSLHVLQLVWCMTQLLIPKNTLCDTLNAVWCGFQRKCIIKRTYSQNYIAQYISIVFKEYFLVCIQIDSKSCIVHIQSIPMPSNFLQVASKVSNYYITYQGKNVIN